jgi:putative intracellular protease/amidase/YHS domain-containing protein
MINRRELLQRSAAWGVVAAGSLALGNDLLAAGVTSATRNDAAERGAITNPLTPPAHGSIPVAFLISEGAVMIDFTGPWEVFQDAAAFRLYTVAERAKTIHASGGMKIVPDYTVTNAPAPKVIVIPAQSAASESTKEWIRRSTRNADVTMSVCTGAFVLASTGLLSGKAATTHHGSYADLEHLYPDIQVKRGARFVEAGNLASSGGLSSGIDLALRVVARYFGVETARRTAYNMEYQGQGWLDPNSNSVYATTPTQTAGHPVCPVCGMDPSPSFTSTYKGKTYSFCSQAHKKLFDDSPEKFLKA